MRQAILVALLIAGVPAMAGAQTPPANPAAPLAPVASPPPAQGEMGELLAAARETAKATREAVEYGRTVPDILTQILIKLDKIEDKLDKVENAVKASGPKPRGR